MGKRRFLKRFNEGRFSAGWEAGRAACQIWGIGFVWLCLGLVV